MSAVAAEAPHGNGYCSWLGVHLLDALEFSVVCEPRRLLFSENYAASVNKCLLFVNEIP